MGQTEINLLMKGINHPTLGMFKKEEYIGSGGFGHVWKVLYCKGDYHLAMKQLSKKEIINQNFVENIFAERNILNIIYNVHIVNLYLTFQDDNYLYMIMDYLEGGDLRKHMIEKKFNIKEIKFIAACIIIALEYIHKKGIIHRDIKPENLIFDNKGYLRISDFGIAIKNNTISQLEKNNDKSGTPGYMAPERIINNININYTYCSDYFSLGVILYELTTLKKPFIKNNDKIGRIKYTSYDEIIFDLFNNESINLTPSLVKIYRNNDNNNNKKENNLNNDELNNLCDLINKLLIYEEKNRLGYNNIEDIKKHPFFGERFEWKKIYHRSYKSPFNNNNYLYKYLNNENKIDESKDISKIDKINFSSEEEKIKFQNKFKDFTIIHKITKEDFNYFYLNGDNSNIHKYKNGSYNIKNYKEIKTMRNTLNSISKKSTKFLSQTKNSKKYVDFNKNKITPNKLFRKNNNINNTNIININKNNISNLIKNLYSPRNRKMPIKIIEENFKNPIKLNKTNTNFYIIKDIKNNIMNKQYKNHLPLINSERTKIIIK